MKTRQLYVAAQVGAHLSAMLAPFGTGAVAQAMRYGVAGGKRIRALLVMESARLHFIPDSRAIWPASGIEALHAYSLIHDDLPCMDDDDERRGRPTVHVRWGDAVAVLAGDALQALAFELTLHPEGAARGSVRAELGLTLARAAGGQGMVLGQALDIAAETAAKPLTLDEISLLQAGKTGALFEWSAAAGARMAGADPDRLIRYARALGLAYQIRDDIIDVTGDARTAGKKLGKDAAAGKATFVSLLGIEGATRRAEALVDVACEALSVYGSEAHCLQQVARFAISRQG